MHLYFFIFIFIFCFFGSFFFFFFFSKVAQHDFFARRSRRSPSSLSLNSPLFFPSLISHLLLFSLLSFLPFLLLVSCCLPFPDAEYYEGYTSTEMHATMLKDRARTLVYREVLLSFSFFLFLSFSFFLSLSFFLFLTSSSLQLVLPQHTHL